MTQSASSRRRPSKYAVEQPLVLPERARRPPALAHGAILVRGAEPLVAFQDAGAPFGAGFGPASHGHAALLARPNAPSASAATAAQSGTSRRRAPAARPPPARGRRVRRSGRRGPPSVGPSRRRSSRGRSRPRRRTSCGTCRRPSSGGRGAARRSSDERARRASVPCLLAGGPRAMACLAWFHLDAVDAS